MGIPSPPAVERSETPEPGVASTDETTAAAVSAERSDLRETFFYCFKVFAGVRIGLGLLALVSVALLEPNIAAGVPGWDAPELTGGWHNLFTAWERWDALWFLRIASEGYANGDLSAAFFPLYPLLVRGVSFLLGGHPLAGALIVSNAASLAALVVVHELTEFEFDRDTARRTVIYLAVFPTAYFFVAPYTESLFLLLAAGSLLAARRKNWPIAGLCGALAAATRSIGIILILPLAIEAFLQMREAVGRARMRTFLTRLGWTAVTALGTLAYLFFWYRLNGRWLTPLSDQNGWLREFSPAWESLAKGAAEALRFIGVYSGGYHQLDLLLVGFALAATVWVGRQCPLPYVAYTIASLLIPLSFIFGGRPFMSMPRFLLPMVPLFWALGHLARRFRAHDAIVAASAALLGVNTLLFVNWYYVF